MSAVAEYPVTIIRDDQLPAEVPWAVMRANDDGRVRVFVKESAGAGARARALAAARENYGPPTA